ncbi:DMT family transporter [Lyngbya confervoides]|uniref:DMT family transporter n=1 Tax=Lyngbya confervoides BDU141951 TaxID=1574623 RepID=A0ABD4T8A0_9CYAN|nr:DMT family transporter [Lyngbya confervoides]MCM1984846.1 DMT family transporter [Lyngbya confervoides BDU141951]
MSPPSEVSPADQASLPRPLTAVTAIAALFLGILAVSFAAIFVRISEQDLGPYATISHRFWIAALALSIGLGGQSSLGQSVSLGQSLGSLGRSQWGLLILAGLISGVDLCVWATSLTQTSVANAAVLGNLAPLFTALGTWLLWKQRFDPRFLVGLAVALAGALTIGLQDFQLLPGQVRGDGLALLSAVFFSAYLLTIEQLRSRLTTPLILLVCSGVAALVSGAISLGLEDHFWPQSPLGWGAVIGLGLISQTLGQGLVAYSLSQLSSGLVSVTFLLEPVVAAIFAWILFGESLGLLNGLGFALVIVGVYLAIMSQTEPTGTSAKAAIADVE